MRFEIQNVINLNMCHAPRESPDINKVYARVFQPVKS